MLFKEGALFCIKMITKCCTQLIHLVRQKTKEHRQIELVYIGSTSEHRLMEPQFMLSDLSKSKILKLNSKKGTK